MKQMLARYIKKYHLFECKLGLHEWRALKGEQAKAIFDEADKKGFDFIQSYTLATPFVCLHCNEIEPGYMKIMDVIIKLHNKKETHDGNEN